MDIEKDNIEALVSRVKEGGVILHSRRVPLKRRRKARERLPKEELYLGSERWRKAHARYQKRIQSTVSGSWYMLSRANRARNKDRAKRGGKQVEFQLTLEDWKKLWQAAGMITYRGVEKAAFYCRGRTNEDVKLFRIDEDKPWRLDNTIILWKGILLANGRKL